MKKLKFYRQAATRLLFGAIVLSIALPVLAQEQAPSTSGPNWLVNCDNQNNPQQLACSMSQSVVVIETGTRLMTAIVRMGDTGPNLALVLPFGLNFRENIRLSVDDAVVADVPFFSCDASGCYARLDLTIELNTSLMQGETLAVEMTDTRGQKLMLELVLDGYASSLALMN